MELHKLNKRGRRKIYWQMYVAAVGLAELYTPEEIINSFWRDSLDASLPRGLCRMLMILFPNKGKIEMQFLHELWIQQPPYDLRPNSRWWYKEGEWKPRAKDLLTAYELTF